MRVRNMAVVGATLVAAWAGGTGIAQADTDTGTGTEVSCSDLAAASTTEGGGAVADLCSELPGDCEFLPALGAEGAEQSDEAGLSGIPCGDDIRIDVEGDCADPETFTFTVDATGLQSNGTYNVLLTDDPLGETGLIFSFQADANGDVKGFTQVESESADDFDFPAGAFTLYFLAGPDEGPGFPTFGEIDVEECKPVQTDPVVVPPAGEPTPVVAPVAAPAAAPVVVTPVAAHPAVLANTGTPVTSAALLGGGLLLAGAGALVASRRRPS